MEIPIRSRTTSSFPDEYYKKTFDKPLSGFLALALDLQDEPSGKTALDLGCGAGNQTRYLLEKGYNVTAVDVSEEVSKYLARLPQQEHLAFVCNDFESFEFGEYDLINCLASLPFVHKDEFYNFFAKLKESLKPGGIFAGQFFGEQDDWNKPGSNMTFLSRENVEQLFGDMDIIEIIEEEGDRETALGEPRHWHVINVVARNPVSAE